jgi:hypothetical protein
MSVDAPLWVLLAASAFGGALLTGLVTLLTRYLDARHRHDDTRRDHYVSMLLAIDEYQETVNGVISAYNEAIERLPGMTDEQAKFLVEQAIAVPMSQARQKYASGRRVFATILLFAPTRVVLPLARVMDSLRAPYKLVRDRGREAPWIAVPDAVFPRREWREFRDAVRRDLCVRRLNVPPAPSEGATGTAQLME